MSQTGGAGRYSRSAGGLVASMVVCVLFVVAVVAFRSVFSRDLEVEPEPIAYLETVGQLQDSDVDVVYPAPLPQGWIATDVDFDPAGAQGFGLSLLTDDGAFVGLRQERDSVDDLLATYVDEDDVETAEAFAASGSVAPTWDGYRDAGGDLAYAAEVADATVLVYGSAPAEDLQRIVESLTDDPLPDE